MVLLCILGTGDIIGVPLSDNRDTIKIDVTSWGQGYIVTMSLIPEARDIVAMSLPEARDIVAMSLPGARDIVAMSLPGAWGQGYHHYVNITTIWG